MLPKGYFVVKDVKELFMGFWRGYSVIAKGARLGARLGRGFRLAKFFRFTLCGHWRFLLAGTVREIDVVAHQARDAHYGLFPI